VIERLSLARILPLLPCTIIVAGRLPCNLCVCVCLGFRVSRDLASLSTACFSLSLHTSTTRCSLSQWRQSGSFRRPGLSKLSGGPSRFFSGAWKANPPVIFPSLRFCLTLMSFESYFHEGIGSSHEGILCGLGLGFRV
jgi:hypothetical protein